MDWKLKKRPGKDLKSSYRPMRLDEAVPTFPLTRVQQLCENGAKGQVFLFEGPTGVGKTTCARIVAAAAVCPNRTAAGPCLQDDCEGCYFLNGGDIEEINAADFRKIEDARELVKQFRYRPLRLNKRIFILDEVHQVTKDAQQVLLKLFEEPPEHVLVFMCTTETKNMKKTLIDRALTVRFREMTDTQARTIITQILEQEEKELDEAIWNELITRSMGSVRALLNGVEAALAGDYDSMTWTEEGPPEVRTLASALMNQDWNAARKVLKDLETDKAESVRIGVENYLRAVTLNQKTVDAALKSAIPMKYIVGTLVDEPKISQYNQLVQRCLRACYRK